MTTLREKIRAYYTEKRRIRQQRSMLFELGMTLDILWEDLDHVEPGTNKAAIILHRIEEVSAQMSAIRSPNILQP